MYFDIDAAVEKEEGKWEVAAAHDAAVLAALSDVVLMSFSLSLKFLAAIFIQSSI